MWKPPVVQELPEDLHLPMQRLVSVMAENIFSKRQRKFVQYCPRCSVGKSLTSPPKKKSPELLLVGNFQWGFVLLEST